MTQAEWLYACKDMESAIRELMRVARPLNMSEPITLAINKDGLSWAEYRECGHRYDFNVKPNGNTDIRVDGEVIFSGKDLSATPRDSGMTLFSKLTNVS